MNYILNELNKIYERKKYVNIIINTLKIDKI